MVKKLRKFWKELTVLAASIAIAVLAFITQDYTGQMVIADRYTPIFFGLAVCIVGLTIATLRRYRAEDKAKKAGAKGGDNRD